MTGTPSTAIETLALQYDDESLNVLPPSLTIEDARRAALWGDASTTPDIVRVRVETLELVEKAEDIA